MVEMALLATVCFVCYLALIAVVVLRTGGTAGLLDVAQAIGSLRQVVVIRFQNGAGAV
ncbi:hypothetical protein [Nocardia sp. NPDC004722]